MKYNDLKDKEDKELIEEIKKLEKELVDKKLEILNNRSNNTSILGKLKKDVARVKTRLNERKQNND